MKITVISACHNANGEPDFAMTEVECTREQYDEGEHYEMAEEQLADNDYEPPFVHFDDMDRKRIPWLTNAVKKYLGVEQSE